MSKTLPSSLPLQPGVYLFKDAQGSILYIGKAKSIRKRVATYFQRRNDDWKIDALLQEYATIEAIVTPTEHEALLLEAQLVKQYQPRHNVLLKSGQPFIYIMLTKDPLPILKIVRNKKEKGTYFGPFIHKFQARAAYHYLIQTFKLRLCTSKIANGCLDYHLGLCAGSCLPDFDGQEYLFRLGLAVNALQKDRTAFLQTIKDKIAEYNQQKRFEKSQRLHEYLENVTTIFSSLETRFTPHKFDKAVAAVTTPRYGAAVSPEVGKELQQLLGLDKPTSTIDCFDISHFQSQFIVGSCIRFKDGKPDTSNFRRFKITSLTQQNDYAALQEIVTRRYKDPANLPDLIVIDGGKGQLSAAQAVLPPQAVCISLAKREERIFGANLPLEGMPLDLQTEVGRLLIALRDYAHHFAVTYHTLRRKKG
ncbi:MAG TPA: GIY-YIG nuclease family protein [Candidatus Limnocylindria bacterium]|nr:GIY-YIG nuclease family protein [Candidatus Limnocylindria bacterium]